MKRSDPIDTESQAPGGHHQMLPPNYGTCFDVVKLALRAMLIILGLGFGAITRVQEKKAGHKCCALLMKKLLVVYSKFKYQDNGQKPLDHRTDISDVPETNEDGRTTTATQFVLSLVPKESSEANEDGKTTTATQFVLSLVPKKSPEANEDAAAIHHKDSDYKNETPILMAAKNGTTEIVNEILERYPVAIHDVNSEKKNVVLLAVENRQPHVYQLLLEKNNSMRDFIFRKVDKDGNSALHLAARLGTYHPWKIPGAALQMQWEIKWYKYVKASMPRHFFRWHNDKGETPDDILKEKHQELVKAGGEWLTSTSESCSVVAALIATVAFATSSTVPGGVDGTNGKPILENEPAFHIFAISSLVTLCSSVTSLVMFLSILTSRRQEKEFGKDLPIKLLVGLTSLFVSIASVLVSFCAGHFFVLKNEMRYAALPVYAVTCLPVTFYALAQFPLYWDLLKATFLKVPQRSCGAATY